MAWLAGRRDDHQLGAQRHAEPDRPQDGAAGCDRRAAPVGHERRRSSITIEPGFPQATVGGLRALGYTVGTPGGEIGSVQAVIVECRPASSTAAPTTGAKAR